MIRICEERGTAAVELAILAPLLVMVLGMVIFVADLGVARIRQRSVVRLAAWEVTTHALSDEGGRAHGARWARAAAQARAEVERHFGGGLSAGLLARGKVGDVTLEPVGIDGGDRIERPAVPGGFGLVLRALGDLLQAAGALQRPLLARWGLNVEHVGVVAEAGLVVEGTGLLPGLPARIAPRPARLELQVDTWALDDGADVPLPGRGTDFAAQVGRIAHFGLGEKLRSSRAGPALDWIPFTIAAPVVSMNYGPPSADGSPVSCGGDDPLARTGRWENGPRVGTKGDGMSPVRCFDTLPIDANGFGAGGGRKSDPTWRQLKARGPWQLGCDRPRASFPDGCGGGGPWAGASAL